MEASQVVRVAVGVFIILSVAFGAPASPFFVSQWWLLFTLLVGANSLQSGLSQRCLVEKALCKFAPKADD